MRKELSSARGKITDSKLLETEKGKSLAHLQLSDDAQRTSWVLVPAPLYKRTKPLIDRAYAAGVDLDVQGRNEELGSHVRLIAERVSASELEMEPSSIAAQDGQIKVTSGMRTCGA